MKAHSAVQQQHHQENTRSVVSPAEPASQQLDFMTVQAAIGNQAMQSALRHSMGTVQRKTGGTGLPNRLKAGIETFSGIAMDDVTVHYNSPNPAHVEALAYTQGSEIHLGPGQEQHLPHEAWHVVQQKQGRVAPTFQFGAVGINDDPGLEREADVMPKQALAGAPIPSQSGETIPARSAGIQQPVQRFVKNLALTPEHNVDTIRQELKTQGLDKHYGIPEIGLNKTLFQLDRAKQAIATLSTKDGSGRGAPTPDYRQISALGTWERLAVSSGLEQKTIDVGHLLADEFFDKNQKALAYGADNLAPQNAKFNERAYRDDVEKPVGNEINLGQDVELTVDLTYGPDLQLPLATLIDRGAIEKLSPPPKLPPPAVTALTVPRRLPTDWKVNWIPILGTGTGALTQPPKSGLFPERPEGGKFDPSKIGKFTPKVAFEVVSESYAGTGSHVHFQQGHAFEDPKGIINPARLGLHPQGARYTEEQFKRGNQLLSDAKRFKILRTTLASLKQPTGTKRKGDAEFKAKLVDLLIGLPSGTLVDDAKKAVANLLQKEKYSPINTDVLSEDEDITSAIL